MGGDLDLLLAAEPGWAPFPVEPPGRERSVFLTSNPGGLELRFYAVATRVFGKVFFGPKCEGPKGHAHGGSITTVLDEAMGKAVWLTGSRCLAGRLQINFRAKVPLGTVGKVEAWVETAHGRRVVCAARLTAASGLVFADASGLFVKTVPRGAGATMDPTSDPRCGR